MPPASPVVPTVPPDPTDRPTAAMGEAAGVRGVWDVARLTPRRCRLILAAVLIAGFVGNVSFIRDCPFDLSGDEAHYWDWSRDLDLSYYSKGPVVAYLIRASCAVFGDTEAAVRYPAAGLAVLTALVTYLTARRLFGSDRVALGAVLLNHIVPMYLAGSFLMTIDPPFFLCWGVATYCAAVALFPGGDDDDDRDEKPAVLPWVGVGLAVGVGFLAKYAALLWFACVLPFLLTDPRGRRALRSPGPYVAAGVALVCTLPVWVWNARHGWASARHVARQTGATAGAGFDLANPFELVAGQVGALGVGLAIVVVAAVVYALGRRGADDPHRRAMRFLALVGVTFLAVNLLASLRTKVQLNWPAPAYFTLVILAAAYLATRLHRPEQWRRAWRWVLWPSVAFAVAIMPILRNPDLLYPAFPWVNRQADRVRAMAARNPDNRVLAWAARRVGDEPLTARDLDFSAKLRGWADLGRHVDGLLTDLGPGAFAMSNNYQQTAQLAFHLPGQPRVYYAGSYYTKNTGRRAQYDLWPGLEQPELRGRDAILLGFSDPAVIAAFDSVERLPDLRVYNNGQFVRQFRLWRCRGYRGFDRPATAARF